MLLSNSTTEIISFMSFISHISLNRSLIQNPFQSYGPLKLSKVLDDLQETGSPITAEAINKKLAGKADDYIRAAKDQVA